MRKRKNSKGLEEMVWKTYVVTTAQRGANPHWDFLRGLEQYVAHNNAELIILPTNGRMTTSTQGEDDEELHPQFNNYRVVEGDLRLNGNVAIRHFPVKAQQMDPTTSWDRFVAYDESAIMPSPKQRMRIVPNSNTDEPKVLMSTGAVTQPNYKDNSWGVKAQLDHTYGAIVIDVEEDGRFHYRQLRSNTQGTFYDLSQCYKRGLAKPVKERAEALVMGDYHCAQIDPVVLEETKRLIAETNPKLLVLHDFFDGYSISHHDQGNHINKIRKAGIDLEDELMLNATHLVEMRKQFPDTKIVVVKSNHDEVLERWLREGRFMGEPHNTKLGLYLLQKVLVGKDALEEGIKYVYGQIPGVRFLKRDDDYKVRGWQLANHGDQGANGARASVRALEAACGRQIVGHRHSPEIFRNLFVVGTSTPLRLDYNKGPSSWLNTHALLYANGQPQLVNIIRGKYSRCNSQHL